MISKIDFNKVLQNSYNQIPKATVKNDGLMPGCLSIYTPLSHCKFMRIAKGAIVTFSVSTQHTYNQDNIYVIAQAAHANTDAMSLKYKTIISKGNMIKFELRYAKTEDGYMDLYISASEPVITIISAKSTSLSKIQYVQEAIEEGVFPEGSIQAVEV